VSLPAGPYLPNDELVAIAWLAQRVPGYSAAMVATSLPKDPAAWPDGFVQVQSLPGGSADVDIPVRRSPMVQVDWWVAPTGASVKPPWGRANLLASMAVLATEAQAYGRPVQLPAGYIGARVQAAYFTDLPSRVDGDPSGYARLTANLVLDWARLAQ
jgi:hypothetical protein